MRNDSMIIIVFSALLLITSACTSEPAFDKAKFADLGRTAEEIKTAITSSNPCDAPEALAQRLTSNIAAVKDKANSELDRDVIAAYSRLLSTYQDGLLLCRSRHAFTNFGYFPKGRIFVSQDLDPVIAKYGLSKKRHVSERTGAYVYSIDGDSIQVIWESAQAQIQNVENMVKYN
jgi:hypothetical protein